MKKIILLCGLTLLVAAFWIWRAAAKPARYGEFCGAPKADVAALIATPQQFRGKTVLVEGRITEQCKSMGCFFFFESGKDKLRVDVQEVAMTAPMREGRQARVEGQLIPYGDGIQLYASAVEFN